VDQNEPPLPGHVKLNQAIHLAEALVKGQKDAKGIVKTIAEDKVREVI
jgi:pyruvate dehydrogenase (quinone)